MMRETYQVNEIFRSVQGEGVHIGKAATFIRLQGCTVGCPWCDSGPLADSIKGRTNGETLNTWGRGGRQMSLLEINMLAWQGWDGNDTAHFIITGGEPTLYDLDALILSLRHNRPELLPIPFIQLETSGQNNLKGLEVPDWITWSPKANLEYSAPETLLERVNEVKFVVDEALEERIVGDTESLFINGLRRMDVVVGLMPEGCPPSPASMTKAYEWALRHPTWRIMDRLQYRLGVR